MKTSLVFLSAFAVVPYASAAYVFTGAAAPIGETFDGLGTATVTGFLPSTAGTQVAVAGTGFEAAKLSGTGGAATSLTADAGGSNAGTVYNYGAAGIAERALGSVASAGVIAGFGFELQNSASSGQIITEILISFTQENWRSSTSAVNTVTAGYGTTDSGVLASSYISSPTGISPATALDLVGPAPVTTNGALDGNLLINQAPRSFSISGLSIDPGESFFIRWQDANDTGNDAGLAIDGLTITINPVPEPGVSVLAAAGAVLGLMRRRRR